MSRALSNVVNAKTNSSGSNRHTRRKKETVKEKADRLTRAFFGLRRTASFKADALLKEMAAFSLKAAHRLALVAAAAKLLRVTAVEAKKALYHYVMQWTSLTSKSRRAQGIQYRAAKLLAMLSTGAAAITAAELYSLLRKNLVGR
jgi:ABC-type uncharacterized transport system permease subunit